MSQRLLQDVRDYKVESRSPVVWRFIAEVYLHPLRVQDRVSCGTRQRMCFHVVNSPACGAEASIATGSEINTVRPLWIDVVDAYGCQVLVTGRSLVPVLPNVPENRLVMNSEVGHLRAGFLHSIDHDGNSRF